MTALVIVITGVLNVDAETGLYVWNADAAGSRQKVVSAASL